MEKRGRSWIAAFMACTIVLIFTAKAYPSYNSEAGRKYTIACQRLADLRKSAKRKKNGKRILSNRHLTGSS